MKGLIAALLAATLGPAAADLTIVQQVQKEGPPQEATVTLTMKIKDGKMRVELGPQVSSIIDLKTGDVVSLLHPQRIAMTIPGASIKSVQRALTEEAIKSVGSSPPPKPTGRRSAVSFARSLRRRPMKRTFVCGSPETCLAPRNSWPSFRRSQEQIPSGELREINGFRDIQSEP
jgi:hypothetical protein